MTQSSPLALISSPSTSASHVPSPVVLSAPGELPRLVVISGNPRTGSRTLGVARDLAERIADDLPVAGIEIIDLAPLARRLFDNDSQVAAAARTTAAADLLIVASPVYKGSYTGLLKVFLDLLPGGALRGVTAVPLVVSAAPDHSFAGDLYLRPVLVELGATVPARSFAVVEDQLLDLDIVVDSWVVSHGDVLRAGVLGNAGARQRAGAAPRGLGAVGPTDHFPRVAADHITHAVADAVVPAGQRSAAPGGPRAVLRTDLAEAAL